MVKTRNFWLSDLDRSENFVTQEQIGNKELGPFAFFILE